MVRRTSEENQEEINHKRIEGVRNRYLESLRENQVAWLNETQNERVREHRIFHAIDHAPGEPHCESCLTRITGYCAICLGVLTRDYPEDFPEEFKFCCSCLGWAKSIFTDRDTEWLKHALNASPTIKKIYERITVFG